MNNDKTWLIYALGGGWGHLTRALSLGRIARGNIDEPQRRQERRGGVRVEVITNSYYRDFLENESCLIHGISHDAGYPATCEKVREVIFNSQCDRLIVDTFPRGLGGELADVLPQLQNIPRILIHRDINPRYVIAKKLRCFVAENFEQVIIPGEGKDLAFADMPNVLHTAPWLIRNAEELPDKTAVSQNILQVDKDVKIILVCASGQTSELCLFAEIALRLHENLPDCAVKILAANCPPGCSALWVSHHPGIECLAAADVVVGGAGYNTIYECASVGVPLVALAFARLYDRQEKRASKAYWVRDVEDALATVRMLLNQVKPGKIPLMPSYINGAVQAVNYIESGF